MRSTLGQSRNARHLAELSTYGVQELNDVEAMKTIGGALPLFGIIAAIVGADAAFMALGFGLLTRLRSNAAPFCPAY